MTIPHLTFAQDKSDKFLTPTSKEMPTKKEMKEVETSPAQINLPNPEIELVSGVKYANNGEYDKAIEIFKTVITKYPNTKVANDAQYMIDKIQQEQRKSESVVTTNQPTKIEIPKEYYPEYQFNLGLNYYQEKNFEEALACFQRVVETAPKDSQLSQEAADAVEKVQKRLKPEVKEAPQEQKVFRITKTKEEIQKEWYEKIVQWQQGLFDEAMKLKEAGKLQEALKVLERVTNSRSSPVGEKATKEMVKIQEELGLLEQIEETPNKNREPGFRKLSNDELPEFEKKIRSGELKVEPQGKGKRKVNEETNTNSN